MNGAGSFSIVPNSESSAFKSLEVNEVELVRPDIREHVTAAILATFDFLAFDGPFPEYVSISNSPLYLPDGGTAPAAYGYDMPGVPGRIYVSVGGCLSSTAYDACIPDYVIVAAYAAHEATEHFLNMRGHQLLSIKHQTSHEEHSSASEHFANNFSRSVIRRLYGITFYFGDELR